MFKKILALMCLTLSIVLFCMAVSATEAETVEINAIYVSENATEGGTGAIDAPVATLAEAYSLLGNSGTIYLMDTVLVSATEGDCFIAPAHTGKIIITSADGYDGELDVTGIEHFHFGGDTEIRNIGIVANEVVLTADNHTVTMGEGLEMSSPSADVYRGGHTYCGAKIHLAAYAPCETANITCESAGGKLNVHSGEYWSVSAWYGDTVTVTGGETQILLDTRNETDRIWLRYLCPGMFSSSVDNTLTSTDSTVTVIVNEGVNTLEAYRFTKNSFAGSMTVNWLLHNSAQGNSYAFIAKDFYPADDAECTLNVYSEPTDISATGCALLLSSGASDAYEGNCGGEAIAAATATNRNAITFNAANFSFEKYGLVEGTGIITNYYVRGEGLNRLIGVSRIGNTKWLKTQVWTSRVTKKTFRFGVTFVTIPVVEKHANLLENHSISVVRQAISRGDYE